MAVAKTPTLLSLDRFAQVMGINPLHFNGVVPSTSESVGCGQPILQYDWQRSDATSRESIAQAIYDAEQLLARELGFNVAPRFEVDDRQHNTGHIFIPEIISFDPRTVMGFANAVQADKGYIISGGIEAKVAIQAGAAVVYSDIDLDGYDETATITVPTTVTDEAEIALYYPGKSAADEWEIRPIQVTIAAGTATIVVGRHQLVLDTYFEQYSANRAVDGTDNTKFLTTVDVYRHYLDPQQQVQFMWEPDGSCGCGSCGNCVYTVQNGCMHVRDYRIGMFAVEAGDWNATTASFDSASFSLSRVPDRVRMWYKAGWRDMRLPNPDIQMDRQFELATARLAMSLLDRPFCECENLKNTVSYWGEDLSLRNSQRDRSTSYQLGKSDLGNPLGPTRAGISAWNLVQRYRLGEGVATA